jgi:hypothetical protein
MYIPVLQCLSHFKCAFSIIIQPRKLSGHNVFAGERLREAGVPGLNTELIKEIPSLWKALPDDEKQVHTIILLYKTVFTVEPLSMATPDERPLCL